MSTYVVTPKHPPHRAALGCADTMSQALGTCCPNCAQGKTCVGRSVLGATSAAGSVTFMIGAGLAIWWALSRKPKRRKNPRRNPRGRRRRLVARPKRRRIARRRRRK